ncbi:GreA/GreB family elongation factor [Sphingomonas sp. ASY06-1R]|uniref:GreA/GreB family elongation factor n=1 Tax=Sphingomonas sp. ASY06-1R TaxID=3445771 RepID=UPI003FA216BA
MSVAFRRESDEEHLEPKFELPIPPGPNLVTAHGLALIEAKVAEYEAMAEATDDQKRTMRYWRHRLASAQLAPPPPEDEVGFGSRVTFTLNGQRREVHIVGEDEAEPSAGRIGLQSPLAQALLGAGAGEMLPFAGRDDAIEVLSLA